MAQETQAVFAGYGLLTRQLQTEWKSGHQMFEFFAQTDAASMSWVNPVIQLVTAGGFGALVWYLVVKHIPGIEARHLEERKEWKESIQSFTEVVREFTTVLSTIKSDLENMKDEVRNIRKDS